MHFDIKCEGCKRRVGGCRCASPNRLVKWISKETCMHCRFKEEDDLLNRKSKKSGDSKDSKPAKRTRTGGI